MEQNRATAIITCLNPNMTWLSQCLASCKGFEKILLNNDVDSEKQLEFFNVSKEIMEKVEFVTFDRHLSISDALNALIRQVKTEWFSCIHHDDFFNDKELKNLFDWIDSVGKGVEVVYFPCTVLSPNGKKHVWGTTRFFTFNDLKYQNLVSFSSFQRMKAFELSGGYSNIPISDWHYWLKAKKAGVKFRFWNQQVYTYRYGHDSYMQKEIKKDGMENIKRMILEDIEK